MLVSVGTSLRGLDRNSNKFDCLSASQMLPEQTCLCSPCEKMLMWLLLSNFQLVGLNMTIYLHWRGSPVKIWKGYYFSEEQWLLDRTSKM